jgi:hypothetical protein
MVHTHSFHIPVMGIGFTIDTPLKVAPYGIDSVISLGDDILMEKMRKLYCSKFEIPYTAITDKVADFRAERITAYLNLMNRLAREKFEELKCATANKGTELKKYFDMLPDSAAIKQKIKNMSAEFWESSEAAIWLKDNLTLGSIDVNIMTKVDKDNYLGGEKLPVEYNDAHAALRGYANSDVNSSLVFSAGMNPRLYSYLEQFDVFYPDSAGTLKKKIVLKVSDYRSALIQGKFLAKKGLWVSEYRVESGLNCGGHAFATDGYLLGPILAEFRDKREELVDTVHQIFSKALADKNRPVPASPLPLKLTAQGGVGTAEEHQFLLDHYKVDSVGWGSPFLLVPEAVAIDAPTMEQLAEAKEEDLYLSHISPLGVPFNNLKGNTKDLEKLKYISKGRPGSSCPKRYLALNKEFSEEGLCTASREYQHLKLKSLEAANLAPEQYKQEHDKVVEKSCICVGLGTSALLVNELDTRVEKEGVSVCPGPNMAYFDKILSLQEMVNHIYGRANVITRTDRPHVFIKELTIYLDYLDTKIKEARSIAESKQEKYFTTFINNLREGIDYYYELFNNVQGAFEESKAVILNELALGRKRLQCLEWDVESMYQGVV